MAAYDYPLRLGEIKACNENYNASGKIVKQRKQKTLTKGTDRHVKINCRERSRLGQALQRQEILFSIGKLGGCHIH
ncbi:MAG: hypothetical protein GWP07_04190 [Xanthomonadaceae bacterium]|nr:hypothetical protein [Xanthomonadaceae bacterium]